MQVELEESGPFTRLLSVTLPSAEVDKAFEGVYRKVAQGAKIPGFRAGKIPKRMLQLHYGAHVEYEVHKVLLDKSLYKAIEKEELTPVVSPSVDEAGVVVAGKDFSYVARIEIQPEISLTKWKGLEIERVSIEPSEQQVDEDVEAMRQRMAQVVPVEGRDVVEEGDFVMMDYKGTLDGTAFQGGSAQDSLVEAGGDGYVKGFSAALIGKQVPSSFKVNIRMPSEYRVASLADQEVEFEMDLKQLKSKDLADLDDDFARDVGEESLADLRAKVLKDLRAKGEREAKSLERKQVLKALIAANQFEVSPAMVREQGERKFEGAQAQMERMSGTKISFSDSEKEEIKRSILGDAEFEIRSGLLMSELAKEAKLEVTPQEIEEEIESMLVDAGEHKERMRAHYSSQEQWTQLSYVLLEKKVITMVMEEGTFVDAKPGQEEDADLMSWFVKQWFDLIATPQDDDRVNRRAKLLRQVVGAMGERLNPGDYVGWQLELFKQPWLAEVSFDLDQDGYPATLKSPNPRDGFTNTSICQIAMALNQSARDVYILVMPNMHCDQANAKLSLFLSGTTINHAVQEFVRVTKQAGFAVVVKKDGKRRNILIGNKKKR